MTRLDVPERGGTAATIPPAAQLAMLTLQLRGAEHEAAVAESDEIGWDLDGALAQLRQRMAPLVDARRVELGAELDAERRRAAAAIADAHATAAAIVEAAMRAAAAVDARVESALAVLPPDAEVVAWADVAEVDPSPPAAPRAFAPPAVGFAPPAIARFAPPTVAFAPPAVARLAPPAVAFAPPAVAQPALAPPVPSELRAELPPVAITVVFDEEAFARALATAFASLPARQVAGQPVVVTRPTRTGFWHHAWHADVVLSAVAVALVAGVLIAWSV